MEFQRKYTQPVMRHTNQEIENYFSKKKPAMLGSAMLQPAPEAG